MAGLAEPKTSAPQSLPPNGMLPIALGTLAPASELDFDLFVRGEEQKARLFRGRAYPLKQADINRLLEASVKTLYIKVAEHEAYCDYLRDVVLENADLPEGRRLQVLTAVNRSVFESAFSSTNANRYIEFAVGFGEDLAEIISTNKVALSELSSLMSHDYYTFTHVANVTTLCVSLAAALGYSDRETLRQIAIGGLLHDYGKRFVSSHTLNFPGRLTEEQFKEIKMHPLSGFSQFTQRDDVNWGQLMMIYQHHERPDGQGYPVGVCGEQIHPWARICKVADVYDALTSERPYRKADSSNSVLEFMGKKVGTEFDEEIFRCFQATINCKN